MLQHYVSDELTHFVGRSLPSDVGQYNLLLRIIREECLRSPKHGAFCGGRLQPRPGVPLSSNEAYLGSYVCFCDIPLPDLSIHMQKYSRFGLSFAKRFLMLHGASPVFYIASTSLNGPPIGRTKAADFDEMHALYQRLLCADCSDEQVAEMIYQIGNLLDWEVLSFCKFFDPDSLDIAPDNYYMEREWRTLRQVEFKPSDIRRIIVPSAYLERLRQDVQDYTGPVTCADHVG